MIKERLGKLREVMKQEGVQCLVIPTSDYHNSEYVSEYFMARKYSVALPDRQGHWW